MADLPTGTVTFLFTDIEGSTRLWEQHPQAMEAALARHDALAAAIIEQYSGLLVKHRGEGDSLFAVFARALDAVVAASTLQQSLLAEPWPAETPLRVRMALHTGDAAVREGDYLGPTVNRCARLRAVAHGGQVVLSQATADLLRGQLPGETQLRDLGTHRLKDLQQPEHLYQLLHPGLPSDFPPLRSLEAFAHNLPAQVTSFIGREQAMTKVKELLSTTRLLTLTGSGGCGKTRLAQQVAAELLEEYADGVWLVELAPLADPALVPQAVATPLGLREQPGIPLLQTLAEALKSKRLLLILDNCEHLLAACAALVEGLLRSCPQVQILASSREGLNIPGEQTYHVPSLSLPPLVESGKWRVESPTKTDPTDPSGLSTLNPQLSTLLSSEAVQLFVDRAVAGQSTFAVTPQNAPAIAQVCRRLDGIPLAIELAAARVRSLPVEQITARLDDRFRLLTGGSRTALPRQQTLRALIDWSYDLLAETERALLRRLSVFAGGWTLQAAEAVCAGEVIEAYEVLDLLSRLVDKSLVVYEERHGEGRYRLLETVRQYSRDRLLEAGEAARVRGCHLRFFVQFAEEAEQRLEGAELKEWLDRLEAEHDNFRTALEWAAELGASPEGREAAEAGLRLGGALLRLWSQRGYWVEGQQWVEKLLALAGAAERTVARASAMHTAAYLTLHTQEPERGRSLLHESLAIFRERGDPSGMARCLQGLGSHAFWRGEAKTARTLLEESLAIQRELGDQRGVADTLMYLGQVVAQQGDPGTGRTLAEGSLALFKALGDPSGIALSTGFLGMAAERRGEWATARSLFEEGLAMQKAFGGPGHIRALLYLLARVAEAQGDHATARAAIEEYLAISRETGDKRHIPTGLWRLASVAQMQGDGPAARALLEEARAVAREVPDAVDLEWSLLGDLLLELGETAAARSRYEERLARQRARGSSGLIGRALLEVGHAAWLQGEAAVTQSCAAEALGLFQAEENVDGMLAALESLAVAALAQGPGGGDPRSGGAGPRGAAGGEQAARLLGAVEARREAVGCDPRWRRPKERIDEAVRAASLKPEFAAAWAEGRAMSLEQALAFASQETDAP
jgi:predicted ATPase/class 3 adenylate cyclase